MKILLELQKTLLEKMKEIDEQYVACDTDYFLGKCVGYQQAYTLFQDALCKELINGMPL